MDTIQIKILDPKACKLLKNLAEIKFGLQQKISIVFNQELVKEFVEVTQRNKFRKYFPLFKAGRKPSAKNQKPGYIY